MILRVEPWSTPRQALKPPWTGFFFGEAGEVAVALHGLFR